MVHHLPRPLKGCQSAGRGPLTAASALQDPLLSWKLNIFKTTALPFCSRRLGGHHWNSSTDRGLTNRWPASRPLGRWRPTTRTDSVP